MVIILIIIALILSFFIYLEVKLKASGSHLELVEIAPLTEKNMMNALTEVGAENIKKRDELELSFIYKGES